jgi:hypothetical protein
MPSSISMLTEVLARHAEREVLAGAEVAALRTAATALEAAGANAATTADQWLSALSEWRAKVTTLTQKVHPGAFPLDLMLKAAGYELPPIPGIDSALLQIPASTPLTDLSRLRDDLKGRASLGPIDLNVVLPSVAVRSNVDPVGQILGILPPSGLALAVSAGPVHGGGSLSFSDQPHWRLAGAFGISLGPVSASAFGILERPGGALSLVLLLGARFTPGIQLGFGFALSGVGGLVGVNRRADTDALRARLGSGAATDALFADDPAANAPAILETLGGIFVAAPGSFIVGPTLQLTWLKLGEIDFMRLDLGIFIEMPGPARILIVGRAFARVGAPGLDLLHLQLDFSGDLDFQKSLANIRAALVNSQALGIFRATGDAAFVCCWGSPPYQVLSIGGFYPGFNPAPAIVAPLRRMALSNDFDFLPGLNLHFEAYLAVTTNTLQLGGRLNLGISIGLSAEGHVVLDSIFQFRPFRFDVDVHGELRVGALGRTFAGVDVSGHITGPGPIVLRAAISIDLWLDDFTWSDTFTVGRGGGDTDEGIDLIPALENSIDSSSLRARGGEDRLVAITPAATDDVPLISPLGAIVFSQHSAPLNLRLERFGGRRLRLPTTAKISVEAGHPISVGVIEKVYFAPGTYLDLTVAQALNMQPYDRLDSGFELAFTSVSATGVPLEVDYQSYYRGRPGRFAGSMMLFDAGVLGLLGARRAAADVTDRSALIVARDESWVTHSSAGVTAASSATAAHVAVRAGNADVALPAADTPISLAAVA